MKINKSKNKTKAIKIDEIKKFITDVYLSKSFEMEFMKYFSKKDYDTISNNFLNTNSKHSDNLAFSEIFASYSIVKIGNECELSQIINKNIFDWFKRFRPNNKSCIYGQNLNKYSSAVIYIESSNKNSLEFIGENNIVDNIDSPKWLQNKNKKVYVIKSSNNDVELKIKSNIKDKLVIKLKGPDILDNLDNMFPFYIDYTNFEINDEKMIIDNVFLGFENSLIYSKNVKDGEIINLKITGVPVNKNILYKSNKSYYNNIKNKIKQLLKEYI